MYNIEAAYEIVNNDPKYIAAGINENVILDSIRLDKSPNEGNKFLEFTFTKNSAVLKHTEWKPNKRDGQSDEDVTKKATNQLKRISQILECWYTKEQIKMSFAGLTSFEEVATATINLLNAADKTKALRVKVVYNDKGYTTLPAYSMFVFIEPMVLAEGVVSKMAIERLDVVTYTRPVADTETPVQNTYGTATTAQDLPF